MQAAITKTIEEKGREIIATADSIAVQAAALYKLYWANAVGTDITALAGGDPATVSTKLSKALLLSGLSVAEQVGNFFGNVEVGEGDHRETAHKLRIGTASAPAQVSPATEAFGEKLFAFAGDVLWLYDQSVNVLKLYATNYVGVAIGANASFPTEARVFGADINKGDLVALVTLAEQWTKLLDNQTVTNGDYAATIARWKAI